MPVADLLHFLIDRKIKESYIEIGRAGHAGTENVVSLRRVGVVRRQVGVRPAAQRRASVGGRPKSWHGTAR
jgi:hypothetical protein